MKNETDTKCKNRKDKIICSNYIKRDYVYKKNNKNNSNNNNNTCI